MKEEMYIAQANTIKMLEGQLSEATDNAGRLQVRESELQKDRIRSERLLRSKRQETLWFITGNSNCTW